MRRRKATGDPVGVTRRRTLLRRLLSAAGMASAEHSREGPDRRPSHEDAFLLARILEPKLSARVRRPLLRPPSHARAPSPTALADRVAVGSRPFESFDGRGPFSFREIDRSSARSVLTADHALAPGPLSLRDPRARRLRRRSRRDPHGGSLRQLVLQARFVDPAPTRLVFVVDGSASPEAERIRARLLRAVEETAAELAPGSSSSSLRWVPVDIEARILWIGGRTIRSTAEDARLRWREEQASESGASAFVRGVADAIAEPPPPEADASRVIETLRLALRLTPPERGWHRTAVIATSRDDRNAFPEREGGLMTEDQPNLVTLLPTDASEGRCSDDTRDWQLTAWLAAQDVDRFHACRNERLLDLDRDHGMRQLTGPVARNPDGTPACRVRVRFQADASAAEERCDARRGWSVPAEYARSLDATAVTCDVATLAGDEEARCREPGPARAAAASGWCLVDEPRGRLAGPWIRLTGGAAPASAEMEIACDLTP